MWMTTMINFISVLFSFANQTLVIKLLHFSKAVSVKIWTVDYF